MGLFKKKIPMDTNYVGPLKKCEHLYLEDECLICNKKEFFSIEHLPTTNRYYVKFKDKYIHHDRHIDRWSLRDERDCMNVHSDIKWAKMMIDEFIEFHTTPQITYDGEGNEIRKTPILPE